MKFVISGGGTGGHIFPGIAIAQALMLLESEAQILFIGGKGQRESKLIPNAGFDFEPILVQSFPRKLSLNWLKVIVKVPAGFFKSLVILSRFKPEIAVGTGGYVCGPVLMAALFLRIPIVIQEQNVFPGLTNRILGRWAKEIHIHFPEAAQFLPKEKIKVTGNPVRPEIVTTQACHEKLGLDPSKMTIFFVGGSQGARSINKAVMNALERLSELASQIQIVHQTGESDFQTVKDAYSKYDIHALVQPFFYNIDEVYACANLVTCRSSAMTLSEVTIRGLPTILIPYPYSAEDHQTFNAKLLEEKGAGIMIADSQLTGDTLAYNIISLIRDKNRLANMASNSKSMGRLDAANKIAESVISLVNREKKGK